MSRTRVFIPSNFTVDRSKFINLSINRKNIFDASRINDRSYHIFKDNLTGEEDLSQCDVYIEDNIAVFLDKLDLIFYKQEERLI